MSPASPRTGGRKRMVYALLTLAFAGLSLWMGASVSALIRRTARWPTVPGKILSRRLGDLIGGVRGPSTHRIMIVEYAYEVNGKPYRNDRVYPNLRTGGDAETMAAIPDPAPVHYNPEDPGEAFLLPQPASNATVAWVAGGVLLTVGLLQLVVALSRTP